MQVQTLRILPAANEAAGRVGKFEHELIVSEV
jgi:hypothetical protein